MTETLEQLCDRVLIEGLRVKTKWAIRRLLKWGRTPAQIRRLAAAAAKRAGTPAPLVAAAFEAYAEALDPGAFHMKKERR